MAWPTFVDDQILDAADLNAIVTQAQTELAALSSLDVAWPLVAQGILDMNSFAITNVIRFFNIYNAAEYDTLQLAVDAVEVSGGCLLIPPNTTIVADGVDIEASNITILGCGMTSVLQITTSSSSGYLLRTGSSSLSNIKLENLKLDGNSDTGTAQAGIIVRRVTGFSMNNVWVNDFSGSFIELNNDGTPGNACIDANLTNVRCNDGTLAHLVGNDIDGLQVSNFISRDCTTNGIDIEADGTASFLRDMRFSNVSILSPGADGVSILGAGASVSTNQTGVYIDGSHVRGAASDGFVIGDASKLMQEVYLSDCHAPSAGADAFRINSDEGVVAHCTGHDATGDGLDMVDSIDLTVRDCTFPDAGTFGIDAEGTTDCRVYNNDVHGFGGSDGVRKDTITTGIKAYGNSGDASSPATNGWFTGTQVAHTGDQTEFTLFTQTIPANTIAGVGQGFRIRFGGDHSSTGTTTVRVKLDGTNIGLTAGIDDGQYTFDVSVVNLTSATQRYVRTTVYDSGTANSTDNGLPTADMTTDIDIIITVENTDNAGSTTVDGVFIELINLGG